MDRVAGDAELMAAVPTPFRNDGGLDPGAVNELFCSVGESGVDGLFVAGTTGEFTALSDDERVSVIEQAILTVGAERTYAHVGAASAHQAVELTRRAKAVGAQKLAAVTPFYFPAPRAALLRYFEQIMAVADGADVYAYYFEARTTTHMEPTLVRSLAELGLTGMKISGQPNEVVSRFISEAPRGFRILSGNDLEFAEVVEAGGAGVVSGVASAMPQPFVTIRDALQTRDVALVTSMQELAVRAVSSVNYGSLAHLKFALESQGLPGGPVRAAVEDVDPSDKARIREAISLIKQSRLQ